MYLGIEIGGTKLQFGVASGDGTEWAAFERRDIVLARGAAGILEQIETTATDLARRFQIQRVGVGFGGPVDSVAGRVLTSHQVEGWDGVELGPWLTARLGVPTRLGNDCDVAALAEARFGAGRGRHTVFYVTVGTGVGGGLAIGGRLHGAGRPAVAEIGHLRPGLGAERSGLTVESLASGLGITAAAKAAVRGELPHAWLGRSSVLYSQLDLAPELRQDLLNRAGGDVEQITGKLVADAAADGNRLAGQILQGSCRVLGWAIAQVITLLAPEVVVVGGGVSLMGEDLFFAPVRREVARYVFPPLAGSYAIVPAALGEAVVVHGAIALAAG